jgi:GxxExxY protein
VGYRLDLLVEELVIIEIKAVDALSAIHQAQLLSYLKLSGKRLGLLINFNVVRLKDGIKRLVTFFLRQPQNFADAQRVRPLA